MEVLPDLCCNVKKYKNLLRPTEEQDILRHIDAIKILIILCNINE